MQIIKSGLEAHLHNFHLDLIAGASITLWLPFHALGGDAAHEEHNAHNAHNAHDTRSLTESVLHNTPHSGNRDWEAFVDAYMALLHSHPAQTWPATARCYTTLTTLFIQCTSAGSTQTTPALRLLTTFLPRLAVRTSHAAASQAASQLSRALAVTNVNIAQRRTLLVHITNMLAWTYFKLHRLHSLPTALKAVIPLEVDGAHALNSNYSRADVTTYRYWRARSLLAEWKVGAAFTHLEAAYRGCLSSAQTHSHARSVSNRRRIAAYWLVTALIQRRCPTYTLLQRNELEWPFAQLFAHTRKGDVRRLYAALNRPDVRSFLIKMGVYTMVREKVECVAHTALLRRTLRLYMQLKGTATPIIPLAVFLRTLQIAHPDEPYTLDVDDAEAVVVSLIDQGLVGASIQHSSRTLVLAKSDNSAFPRAV